VIWLGSPSLTPDRKVCLSSEHRRTAPPALRITATTICLGLRRPRNFNRVTSARSGDRGICCIATVLACKASRDERCCRSWRCLSPDRWMFPTDAGFAATYYGGGCEFLRPCIIGHGSSSSQRFYRSRSSTRPPDFPVFARGTSIHARVYDHARTSGRSRYRARPCGFPR
jgi:hypothetical protein